MKIYNPTGFSSNLTGSFSGSVKGVFDGTFTSTATTEISGAFDSVSSSLSSRVTSQETFSSSLDNTFATDADLNIVSASVDALNAATSSYALKNSISGSFTSTSQSLASELLKNTTDTLTGDLTVTGTITAQEFHTEFVSASILFDSGSTKFGDTSDDNHDFTGSLKVSSSIYTTSQTFTPQDTTINSTNTSINSTNIIVGNNTSDNVYVGDSTLNVLGGKVGIGTTTLNALLTISGSANQNSTNPGISLTNSHNSQTVLFIKNGTTRGYELAVGGSSNSIDPGSFYIYDATAAAARFIINSSGNVGIGQTPSSFTNWRTLEIKGLSNGSLLNFEDSGSTRTGAIAMNDASSLMRFQTFTDADITFEPNNSEVMRVTGDGKVGIGTNNPDVDRRLHIKNTDDVRGILIQNTFTGSYAELHLSASREYRVGTGGSASDSQAQDNFYIYDRTAAQHRITLDSSGAVGIGTTSPNGQLTVKGTTQTVTTDLNANLEVGLSIMGLHTTDNVGITIGKANSTKNSGVVRYHHNTNGGNDNYVGIGHYAADDILNITSGGSVGIGTTTPLTDLHVNNQSSDAQVLVQGANKMALHQDAAWNSNILLGCYYDGSNVVYGTANRGAFKIVGLHDSTSQSQTLSIYGADGGTAGSTVTFNSVGFSQDEDGNVKIGDADDTPFATQFALAVKGDGNRVAYFDGNSSASVWWGIGNTPQFAIDSMAGGGATFWTHVSGTWKERMRITSLGAIEIAGAGTTVNGNAIITNTNTLATFGSTQSSGVPKDMAFFNGSERMRIQATTGYVGIGTNNPSAFLDVQTTTTGNLLSRVYNVSTDTSSSTTLRLASGANSANSTRIEFSDLNYYTATISGDRVQGIVFRASATGTNPTTIPERMRISSDGMVGIGMTPNTAGASTYMLQMYNPGSQCFLSIGNGTSGNGPLNGLVIGNDTSNAYIVNREATSLIFATSDANRMTILAGGNVGIGTTSPSSRLHVYKSSGDTILNIQAVSAGDPGITFTSINNRTGNLFYSDGSTNAKLSYDHNDVSFKLYAHNTTVVDFLLNETTSYFPTQNVGIGTSSPNVLLQLRSNINTIPANTDFALQSGKYIRFLGASDGNADYGSYLYAPSNGIITLGTRWTSTDEGGLTVNRGNVGIGTTNPAPKLHLVYSGGSYATDATSGFINQATTGRATQRIRSITDNPAELFFDIDGGIRWDISVRGSSSNYKMSFYPQGATVGYANVSSPVLQLEQDGDVYMPVGNVGIGVTTTSYKLEVNGGFAATAITETSALKFKENITPLSSQLEIINKLNPVNFDWKEDGKKDFGFIADEVEEIISELVSYKADEVHGLHYSKLTPILVKALQEQQTQIEVLKQEIKKLKEI